MAQLTRHATIIAAAAILGGCSFISDTLFPDLFGDEPAAPREQVQIPPSPAERAAPLPAYTPAPPPPRPTFAAGAPPPMGTTTFQPTPVTPGQPTGTLVGRKVGQLRGDLIQMQGSITRHNTRLQRVRNLTVQNSQRYHGTVAAINSRLQVGTTPGNPVLVSQWNAAQVQLDQISGDIARMNTLANGVASDSAMAGYLLESTRATYGLTGAVDEDHRQLAILEDEVNRTVVLIDRLLNELSEDINRQSNYIGNERKNLTTLSLAIKNGEILGTSLSIHSDATSPLVPGQVMAYEMVLASPDQGLRVTLEDVVVVTDDGYEILSAGLPTTILKADVNTTRAFLAFLNAEFSRLNCSPRIAGTICTLAMARVSAPDIPSRRLGALCNYFGIKFKDHHSAMADARATLALLRICSDIVKAGC
ncbi:MAG: 3'-5' exonuclease, partial [Proteobacteria bacterium]|nr:3'-5' exonuclease [Pseudomonadota bacterium]